MCRGLSSAAMDHVSSMVLRDIYEHFPVPCKLQPIFKPSMDHPWTSNTLCQSIHGCHIYSGHPWMSVQPSLYPVSVYIHGMPHILRPSMNVRPTFPSPCVRVSMDATYTQAIHGSSIDIQHPVSEYPWMPHIDYA